MAGEVWQAQPAAASAPAGPALLYARRSLSARSGRGAGRGGFCREGKGWDAPGLGRSAEPGLGLGAAGEPDGARPARPCGRSLRSFPLAVHLCPLHRSHGGTQGFLPRRMFIIAPVRVLGCQRQRAYV